MLPVGRIPPDIYDSCARLDIDGTKACIEAARAPGKTPEDKAELARALVNQRKAGFSLLSLAIGIHKRELRTLSLAIEVRRDEPPILAMVELLVEHGASIMSSDSTGYSPLQIAARRGRVAVLESFLTNIPLEQQHSALHEIFIVAAMHSRIDVVLAFSRIIHDEGSTEQLGMIDGTPGALEFQAYPDLLNTALCRENILKEVPCYEWKEAIGTREEPFIVMRKAYVEETPTLAVALLRTGLYEPTDIIWDRMDFFSPYDNEAGAYRLKLLIGFLPDDPVVIQRILSRACGTRCRRVVEMLIAADCDAVMSTTIYGMSPTHNALVQAILHGDIEIVTALTAVGIDCSTIGKHGTSNIDQLLSGNLVYGEAELLGICNAQNLPILDADTKLAILRLTGDELRPRRAAQAVIVPDAYALLRPDVPRGLVAVSGAPRDLAPTSSRPPVPHASESIPTPPIITSADAGAAAGVYGSEGTPSDPAAAADAPLSVKGLDNAGASGSPAHPAAISKPVPKSWSPSDTHAESYPRARAPDAYAMLGPDVPRGLVAGAGAPRDLAPTSSRPPVPHASGSIPTPPISTSAYACAAAAAMNRWRPPAVVLEGTKESWDAGRSHAGGGAGSSGVQLVSPDTLAQPSTAGSVAQIPHSDTQQMIDDEALAILLKARSIEAGITQQMADKGTLYLIRGQWHYRRNDMQCHLDRDGRLSRWECTLDDVDGVSSAHLPKSPWGGYSDEQVQLALSLRLAGSEVYVLPTIMISEAAPVGPALPEMARSNSNIILAPIIYSIREWRHWAGIKIEKAKEGWWCTYSDSENNPLPQTIARRFTSALSGSGKIHWRQLFAGRQSYSNNCGTELVENVVQLVTGRRVDEAQAFYLHSYLLQIYRRSILVRITVSPARSAVSSRPPVPHASGSIPTPPIITSAYAGAADAPLSVKGLDNAGASGLPSYPAALMIGNSASAEVPESTSEGRIPASEMNGMQDGAYQALRITGNAMLFVRHYRVVLYFFPSKVRMVADEFLAISWAPVALYALLQTFGYHWALVAGLPVSMPFTEVVKNDIALFAMEEFAINIASTAGPLQAVVAGVITLLPIAHLAIYHARTLGSVATDGYMHAAWAWSTAFLAPLSMLKYYIQAQDGYKLDEVDYVLSHARYVALAAAGITSVATGASLAGTFALLAHAVLISRLVETTGFLSGKAFSYTAAQIFSETSEAANPLDILIDKTNDTPIALSDHNATQCAGDLYYSHNVSIAG